MLNRFSESAGSLTPQLEGAPCSQSHELRQGFTPAQTPLLPDLPPSGEEKGGEGSAAPLS